jgi:hypothetical protein
VETALTAKTHAEVKVLIGGSSQPISTIPCLLSSLFPGGTGNFTGRDGRRESFIGITSGVLALELVLEISYESEAGREYHTHEKARYRHD